MTKGWLVFPQTLAHLNLSRSRVQGFLFTRYEGSPFLTQDQWTYPINSFFNAGGGQSWRVMHPECAAYKIFPRSHVTCVDCHIGSGAAAYLSAKVNCAKQLVESLSIRAQVHSRLSHSPTVAVPGCKDGTPMARRLCLLPCRQVAAFPRANDG